MLHSLAQQPVRQLDELGRASWQMQESAPLNSFSKLVRECNRRPCILATSVAASQLCHVNSFVSFASGPPEIPEVIDTQARPGGGVGWRRGVMGYQ